MDVGSSNGLERQPTCLFVQVIIRCVTAKAGCAGSFGSLRFLLQNYMMINQIFVLFRKENLHSFLAGQEKDIHPIVFLLL